MFTRRSFYVTLPSNVKSPGHHKNVTSEYTTYLPKALELNKDKWECALVEISYPHSWDNIIAPFDTIKFQYFSEEEKKDISTLVTIPNSYYRSLEEVVDVINSIKPTGFRGGFGFEKKGRQLVKLVLFENEGVKMHTTLAKLLGFDSQSWRYIPPATGDDNVDRIRIKARFHGDIRALHYNIYVYSSVIEPHLCGTQYLPLLRTVNVEGDEGSYISKVYEIPHYFPLATDFIESIDIRVTDDLAQNIKFQYGKIICQLHFRQKSFLY